MDSSPPITDIVDQLSSIDSFNDDDDRCHFNRRSKTVCNVTSNTCSQSDGKMVSRIVNLNQVTTANRGECPHSETGLVHFLMRRKNRVITLQWEPFTGFVSANGIQFIYVYQQLMNLPPYKIEQPLWINYNGIPRLTKVIIDPYNKNGQIAFQLSINLVDHPVHLQDTVEIPGSNIQWIIEEYLC